MNSKFGKMLFTAVSVYFSCIPIAWRQYQEIPYKYDIWKIYITQFKIDFSCNVIRHMYISVMCACSVIDVMDLFSIKGFTRNHKRARAVVAK